MSSRSVKFCEIHRGGSGTTGRTFGPESYGWWSLPISLLELTSFKDKNTDILHGSRKGGGVFMCLPVDQVY